MTLEPWIKSIPESQSHGSGTLQKRLWKLTSDYVRIRDWYKFDKKCIATGKTINHWSEGDAGHLKNWSVCRGMFKFDLLNIHLQAPSSNRWNTSDTWFDYAKELEKRWGVTREGLNQRNLQTPLKFSTEDVKDQMRLVIQLMGKLPEQPPYYKRVIKLMEKCSTENQPTDVSKKSTAKRR